MTIGQLIKIIGMGIGIGIGIGLVFRRCAPLTPMALELTFDDIAYVPVVDASSVSDWNDFFDLPTNGTPFSSVVVDGNVVKLYGGESITLKESLFASDNPHLTSIVDYARSIVAAANGAFEGSPLLRTSILSNVSLPSLTTLGNNVFLANILLTSIYLPNVVSVGEEAFGGCELLETLSLPLCESLGNSSVASCTSITTIYLPLCTSFGDDAGVNSVFNAISGNTISLTIPSFLMTSFFDGISWTLEQDISYLVDNNTVTIVQI